MSKKKQVSRSNETLSEKAYHAIRNDILRGYVAEGTFLSEADVCERHSVGRTPFREACNRLHHEGILEVVPRRGYLVREMSFRDVRDMFEVRVILEGATAELAAQRATEAQIDELEALARTEFTGATANEQYERISQVNTEFHLVLARMSQNRELSRLVGHALDKSERLAYMELRSGRWHSKDIQSIHRAIVDAVRRHDPAASRDAVVYDICQGQIDIFGPGTAAEHAGKAKA
ncbi:MAG TPA: GntR family transcriptional regulator [Bryobacteraceae bacterium]|jgi:DNA-binding GntR family transcriptional regulator